MRIFCGDKSVRFQTGFNIFITHAKFANASHNNEKRTFTFLLNKTGFDRKRFQQIHTFLKTVKLKRKPRPRLKHFCFEKKKKKEKIGN